MYRAKWNSKAPNTAYTMQKRKAQGPRCARAMRNKGWRSKTIMSKTRQIPCEVKGSIRNLQGPCRLRGSIAPVKVENCKYHGIWAALAPKIFKHHVEQQFFQHKATRHRSPQGLRIHNSVSKIELNAMELAKTCLREQTQSIHVTRYCIEHLHGIIWSNFKGREMHKFKFWRVKDREIEVALSQEKLSSFMESMAISTQDIWTLFLLSGCILWEPWGEASCR
jgi:hypothetical protein